MKNKYLAGLVILLTAWACSPATRITASWVEPTARNNSISGKTLFIASLTRNMEVRQKLENALEYQAGLRQIPVIKSTDRFSPDFYQNAPTEPQMLSQIKDSGAELILTVSLLDTQSETRYVSGTRGYAPFTSYRWYGGFYSYFNHWRPTLYDPGYYVTDKTYFLETNLYRMSDNQLIWSAQSETLNPGSIDNFVNSYPKIIMDQLVRDGLLTAM